MSKQDKLAKSALIIVIISLLSKFLGFFRETLIAAKFGSGAETDTYIAALSAIGVISGLVGSSISTTFIPVLSEVESLEGKEGKNNHTNNILNVVIFTSFFLILLAFIGAPLLMKLIAVGFEGEQLKEAILLTRIGLPTVIFGGIIAVFTGYLHSEKRFGLTSAVGFPMNITFMVFLIFLTPYFGIKGLMITGVVASLSQTLLLAVDLKKTGYKYLFTFDLRDNYLIKFIQLTIPIYIGIFVGELNVIIDKRLASNLIEGSMSALNYGNRLNGLILGVFISAITTVIFPLISEEASKNNIDGVKQALKYGFNIILLITVPATIGMIVLAKPIVQIAFQRGKFDDVATLMTSQALIFYAVGLVANALRLLLIRVYYSLQDTKVPMMNGMMSVVFNIIFNLILVKFMAHGGLALATSIATIISSLMLLYGLKKKIGSLGTKEYISNSLRIGLASAVMGFVAYFTYYGMYNILGVSQLYNLISLLLAVGLALLVYGVLCYIFKIEEVRDMVDKIKSRLIRSK